ncbi:MAG: 6-phosphofructokinase [Myxococcales bacterium]|nr:6-phosphofructokinase [Myxococcales bacterium]
MRRIAVLTSGGDAPGMNAALRTIAKVAAVRGIEVVGFEDGYDGLIDGRARALTRAGADGLATSLELGLAGNLGGTWLGSSRSMRFMTPEGRAEAAKRLDGFSGLVVIGGNGSLTGAHKLAEETGVRVMGVPASIDNDVGCTSTAIGVDSALNVIVEACDRISDTARSHRRAFIVEVMGRHSGYLAMASAVAVGADGILFREQGRSEAELVKSVADVLRRSFSRKGDKRRVLIMKAEGVEIPCTRLVRLVEAELQTDLPEVEVRATVLGHLVRGGNPSYQDRMVAGRLGLAALEALLAGETDQMVAWLPQQVVGGVQTSDPAVQRFTLPRMLEETRAMLDGTSEVTRWRVAMIEQLEGALGL